MKQYPKLFDRFIPWGEEEAHAAAVRLAELRTEGTPGQSGKRYPCKMCTHANRVILDEKVLTAAESLAKIAEQVAPTYHYQQVQHHRDAHLLPRLGQIYAPDTTALDLMTPLPFGASIQRKLEWYRINFLILRQRHLVRSEDGEVTNDPADTAMIMRLLVEARNTDVIAMKFREGDGAKPVNGIDGAKWERIKARLSAALEGHPEAKLAVLEALEDAE